MDAECTIKVLQQNEDTIAAILENLQLGRLEDCMKHYTVLQNNLVRLATEVDNYPSEESDTYEKLNMFGDEITRHDLLDEFLPFEEKSLPIPPVVPPCDECSRQKLSAEHCRVHNLHIDMNSNFSRNEQGELIHAAQIMLAKQRQRTKNSLYANKRTYKRWSEYEKYSLQLALAQYGMSLPNLEKVFINKHGQATRTANQIRHFISKQLKYPLETTLEELLRNIPQGYEPPALLAPLFQSIGANDLSTTDEVDQPVGHIQSVFEENQPSNKINYSRLESNNFFTLFSRALDYAHFCSPFPDSKLTSNHTNISSFPYSNVDATANAFPPKKVASRAVSLVGNSLSARQQSLLPSEHYHVELDPSKDRRISNTGRTSDSMPMQLSSPSIISSSSMPIPNGILDGVQTRQIPPFVGVHPANVISRATTSASSSSSKISVKDNQQKAQYLLQYYQERDRKLQQFNHSHYLSSHQSTIAPSIPATFPFTAKYPAASYISAPTLLSPPPLPENPPPFAQQGIKRYQHYQQQQQYVSPYSIQHETPDVPQYYQQTNNMINQHNPASSGKKAPMLVTESFSDMTTFAPDVLGNTVQSIVADTAVDLPGDKSVMLSSDKKKTKQKLATKQAGKEKCSTATPSPLPEIFSSNANPFHQSFTAAKKQTGTTAETSNAYRQRENDFPGISCEEEQIPLEMDAYDGSNCGILIPSLTNEFSFM